MNARSRLFLLYVGSLHQLNLNSLIQSYQHVIIQSKICRTFVHKMVKGILDSRHQPVDYNDIRNGG